MISQNIIWEVRVRKICYILLERASRGLPQKRVNLRRSEHRNFGYITFIFKKLTRDKDTLLQPVHPTQILMYPYGLEYDSKGGLGIGLSMPREGSDGMEDGPVRVHDRRGVWCEGNQSKSSNNRELINLVELL